MTILQFLILSCAILAPGNFLKLVCLIALFGELMIHRAINEVNTQNMLKRLEKAKAQMELQRAKMIVDPSRKTS